MKISKKLSAIFALLILTFATSCVETVLVSSVAGSALVLRHKTVEETKNDTVIAAKLAKEFLHNGLKNPGNSVDFTINEGRVLLTGVVREAPKAKMAQDLAWAVPSVKEVIDEIQIRDEEKLKVRDVFVATRDYLITAEAETKILFARDVASLNYKITTVSGVIYLLGVADNDFEMRRVLSIASKIRGVTRVVNHVILRDDRRRS
jgi:osmotically-inducible protein OsmY